MEHGISWLSFLPGYQAAEAALQAHTPAGVLSGQKPVLQHVLAALLVAIVMLLTAASTRAAIARAGSGAVVPDARLSLRNITEVLFEMLYKQMRDIIGKDCARYFPVLATLTLFILFSNLLGLLPGFLPPTDNWNTTFACGIFVFLYYNYHGLRAHGLGHLAHMANPTGEWWGWFLAPLMLPIELVSHVARPFSLGVRLATNMMGDHAVLAAFLGMVPVLVPIPLMLLGLIVALVQTMVFVLLSMVYIAMVTHDAHHEHPQGHHATDRASIAHDV